MGRRFTRLKPASPQEIPGASTVPDDGLCLSVFLVLSPPGRDAAVLLGRIDPSAPWDEIGALDPERVRSVGDRWMLPSSQLIFFESPQEATQRILKEQLDSDPIPLEAPAVFSEAYRRPGSRANDPHWDFHFIFRGRWPDATPPKAAAFRELAFVDVTHLALRDLARNQGDVLTLVGLSPKA